MNSDSPSREELKTELMKAQEINFAKVLAGNDKKLRDRAVKKLTKWLSIRSKGKKKFTDENFKRIWTGLFYCMWMSDKFLIQEELAESISKLIHCFRNNPETALLFMKGFYKIMSVEWVGIDQHRIDKFCMLIRRFLRQSLEYCRRADWEHSLVKSLCDVFEETVLNHDVPNGYLVHFIDIYPEEIAKISKGKLTIEITLTLYEPMVKLLATTQDDRQIKAIFLFFNHIIRQSNIGIEYEEKLRAWKQMGMPSDRPEDLEMVMVDEEDSMGEDSDLDEMVDNGPMDPRAGKVDVVLHQIPVDFAKLISLVDTHMKSKHVTPKGIRSLRSLKAKFEALQRGKPPETIVKPAILNEKPKRRHTLKCVKDIMEFTEKLKEQDEDEGEFELSCDEVDSDDEVEEEVSANEESDDENHEQTTKQQKKKKKKRKKRKTSPEKVEKTDEKVQKGKKEMQKVEKVQKKVKDKPLKLKSAKEAFVVEDIGKESNKLVVTPSKKRKVLSAWQIHDMEEDSDEYKKITVPKIIQLETKVSSPVVSVVSDKQNDEISDTPQRRATPLVKLTPSFWDKAREKASPKNRKSGSTLLPNPFFPNEQSKNQKRISFALERNEAQENEEYLEEVRNSPNIPFDASRKPVHSVLKSGLSPSPINPFYRFKRFK